MKCQIIDKNNNVIDTIGINIYKSTLLKEEKAEKIGEGMDTNVFKKNNIVYKIIKPNGNIHLSLLTAKYLQQIETKRILLPENIIIDKKGYLIGTTSTYIKKNGKVNILDLDKESFIKEIQFLEKDLDLLTRKKVVVRDLNLSNSVYNGKNIYFVDYGAYTEEKNISFKQYPLDIVNRRNLFYSLIDDILIPKITTELSSKVLANNIFPKYKLEKETISHYLSSLIGDNENFRELILKKKQGINYDSKGRKQI